MSILRYRKPSFLQVNVHGQAAILPPGRGGVNVMSSIGRMALISNLLTGFSLHLCRKSQPSSFGGDFGILLLPPKIIEKLEVSLVKSDNRVGNNFVALAVYCGSKLF
jgi:hypothetical protein